MENKRIKEMEKEIKEYTSKLSYKDLELLYSGLKENFERGI